MTTLAIKKSNYLHHQSKPDGEVESGIAATERTERTGGESFFSVESDAHHRRDGGDGDGDGVEVGIQPGSPTTPPSSATTAAPNQKKLTAFQSSSVLVNFVSVGYILLPGALTLGGTVLTPICLALVSLQSYISGTFVLEACARAEALTHLIDVHGSHPQDHPNESSMSSSAEAELASVPSGSGRSLPRDYSVMVYERKFELSELCRFFMGRRLRNFFTLTTMGDLYGLTWALAVVFGSALADGIPLSGDENRDSKVYVLIFGAVTAALACVSIPDQIAVQLTFLAARLVMVALMVATAAVAYVSDDVPQFGTQVGPQLDVPIAAFRNTVGTLVMCVFATAFQFSVPSLTSATGNKKQMVPVLKVSVGFVYASNLLLSVVVAVFFGLTTNQSSNLNWVDYHGGTWDGEGDIRENRAGWATFISQYIVLFAAIDGVAVYPLCAISLGDIMMGAVYEDRVHEVENRWTIRTSFRLLASIPQAVLAIFVDDLGVM